PPVPPLPPEAPAAEAPPAATPPPPEPPPATRRQDPAATQRAALPPAGAALAPDRFVFAAGSAELSDQAKRDLETLAGQLRAEADRRIQLLAYAGGETGASRARRLSLSRALAVRAFLVEKGVATGRVDVRALGGKVKEGPADRVDVVEARR
ncbi:MAG: OmpA family protein, partial [Rhodospirillales bacterium]|nr:OmpA family protein [Rhodospirillales bacterium]